MTGDDGTYSVQSLPVGRYSVSAAPQGFKKTVATGVEVHVADRVVVDLNLEVGRGRRDGDGHRRGAARRDGERQGVEPRLREAGDGASA